MGTEFNCLVEQMGLKIFFANMQDHGIRIKSMEKGNALILMVLNIKVPINMTLLMAKVLSLLLLEKEDKTTMKDSGKMVRWKGKDSFVMLMVMN